MLQFFGGVVAVLLGALGAFLANRYLLEKTQAFRRQQEIQKDAWNRRDRRADRLRAHCVDVVSAAYLVNTVVEDQRWGYVGETSEQRDVRLRSHIAEAMDKVDRALIALELETDGIAMLEKINETRNDFTALQAIILANVELAAQTAYHSEQGKAPIEKPQDSGPARGKVQADVKHLIHLTKTYVREL